MKIIQPMNRYLLLPLAISVLAINSANADKIQASKVSLPGGSNTTVTWNEPENYGTHPYRIYVWVPADSTATNALYHVYPKGNGVSSNCSSTDANNPCYEIPIDTTQHLGEYVQLTLNNDPQTQWNFNFSSNAGGAGFVSVNASNLSASETLTTGSILFDNPRIGQPYQGGIIVSLTNGGQHGLIAANQDLPSTYSFNDAQTAVKNSANYDAAGQAYSDWRVPTSNEIDVLFQHKELINATGTFYWTSSFSSKAYAWLEVFQYPGLPSFSGYRGPDADRTYHAAVRPVRSF